MKQQYIQASLWRRAIAYLIDWYVSAVCISIPIMMMYQRMFSTLSYRMNMLDFPFLNAFGLLLICIGILFVYFIWIPYRYDGKTLGKKMMGIQVVHRVNDKVTISCLCLRQFVGCFLLEGSLYTITPLILQVVFYEYREIIQYVIYGYYIVTLCSIGCLLIRKKAFHDICANTMVIHG